MPSRLGRPNRSSMRAELTCQVRKFSSIDSMIDAAEMALERFQSNPDDKSAFEYLKIYAKIASDIASFCHPKRKAIEVSKTDALKDMTPVQRLEAMKQAVAMLELQVKKEESK